MKQLDLWSDDLVDKVRMLNQQKAYQEIVDLLSKLNGSFQADEILAYYVGALIHLSRYEDAISAVSAVASEGWSWRYLARMLMYDSDRSKLRTAISKMQKGPDTAWSLFLEAAIIQKETSWYGCNQDELDRARRILEVATSMNDCCPSVYLEIAETYRPYTHADAINTLAKGLRLFPDSYLLRLEFGRRLVDSSPTECLEIIRPLVEEDLPYFEELWMAFQCNMNLQRYDEALGCLDKMAPDVEERMKWFRAHALLGLNRTQEAIQLYDACTASSKEEIRNLGLLGRSRAWLSLGQPRKAVLDVVRVFKAAYDSDRETGGYYIVVPGFFPPITTDDFVFDLCTELLEAVPPRDWMTDENRGFVACALYEHSVNDGVGKPIDLLLEAIRLTKHKAMYRHLAVYHKKQRNIQQFVEAFLAYLEWARLTPTPEGYRGWLDYLTYELDYSEMVAVCQVFAAHLTSFTDPELVTYFGRFLYFKPLRDLMIKHKLYSELLNVAKKLVVADPSNEQYWFDLGYANQVLNKPSDAENAYKKCTEINPDNAACLSNLGLIWERRGKLDEALKYFKVAAQKVPNWDTACQAVERVTTLIRQRTLSQSESDGFWKSATGRWEELTDRERGLLSVMVSVGDVSGPTHLADLAFGDVVDITESWQRLLRLGMVHQQKDRFTINPYVHAFAVAEGLTPRIVLPNVGEKTTPLKPVFNSKREYSVYQILLSLFPNHLVFPNLALSTLFRFEAMKGALSPQEFGYYLRATVDYCITSTVSYMPIVAIEVDSDLHDNEERKVKDGYKNTIFEIGGLPLLRVRPDRFPSESSIRQYLRKTIEAVLPHLSDSDTQFVDRPRTRLEGDILGYGKPKRETTHSG